MDGFDLLGSTASGILGFDRIFYNRGTFRFNQKRTQVVDKIP